MMEDGRANTSQRGSSIASVGECGPAISANAKMPADPILILGPPRSFTSIVCAMLGQHPQTYGLPELQLLRAETISEWWELCSQATFPMTDGLLRAIAQVY